MRALKMTANVAPTGCKICAEVQDINDKVGEFIRSWHYAKYKMNRGKADCIFQWEGVIEINQLL